MIQLTIDMPEGALAAVHHDPRSLPGRCGWRPPSSGMKCAASPRGARQRLPGSPAVSS